MSNIIDLGYSFKPVEREEFDELLRVIRVDHGRQLNQRAIEEGGIRLWTVFIVDGEPVAVHAHNGQHYVRAT